MKDSRPSIRSSERGTGYKRPNGPARRLMLGLAFQCVLAVFSCTLAFATLAPESQTEPASEYQVKALFLYNFAKFVDWPAASFASPREPFTFCVVGDDPFGGELDQAVRGKTINGRKLVVRRVSKAQDVRSCQIAFIGFPDERHVRKILDELNSASVLTVGGINGFMEWGGVIEFTLQANKVRFEINVEAAEHAGLKISSKLLSLAKVVKRGVKA